MAERLNAAVLKTVDVVRRPGVQIPPLPPNSKPESSRKVYNVLNRYVIDRSFLGKFEIRQALASAIPRLDFLHDPRQPSKNPARQVFLNPNFRVSGVFRPQHKAFFLPIPSQPSQDDPFIGKQYREQFTACGTAWRLCRCRHKRRSALWGRLFVVHFQNKDPFSGVWLGEGDLSYRLKRRRW